MQHYYDILNLPCDASLDEVKSSFRRLAKQYHPDTAEDSALNSRRFHKIYEAYRALLGTIEGKAQENSSILIAQDQRASSQPWRYEGVRERGAEVVYSIKVCPAVIGTRFVVELPWNSEEACPRCLGLGHTLAPIFGGPTLKRVSCLKCRSTGVIKQESTVQVLITPEVIRRGSIRLKGLGHYRPTMAERGDLLIEVQVEKGQSRSQGFYSA